MAREW